MWAHQRLQPGVREQSPRAVYLREQNQMVRISESDESSAAASGQTWLQCVSGKTVSQQILSVRLREHFCLNKT